MKKSNYIFLVAVMSALLASCSSTYQFCQVTETKPVNNEVQKKGGNGEYQYENSQCIISYNFWSNGGSADFEFYNKTNEIIYIDLAKSFFVIYGEAHDIYRNREWSQGSTESVASSMSYGYGTSLSAAHSVGMIEPIPTPFGSVTSNTTKSASRSANVVSSSAMAHSESSTVTVKEKQIIAVPPHCRKRVKTYSISTGPMLSCDMQRYPSQMSRLNFTLENSPCQFSEIITYTVGDNVQPITINNEFYVSSVTNYAEPEIVLMKEREELCENIRNPDYVAPEFTLYDKVIRDSICETACSFYNTYSITSYKKLYTNNNYNNYIYDNQNQAYILKGTNVGSGSGKKTFLIGLSMISVAALIVLLSNIKK